MLNAFHALAGVMTRRHNAEIAYERLIEFAELFKQRPGFKSLAPGLPFSLAAFEQQLVDVRFTPESGHVHCGGHVCFGPIPD